MSMAPLGVMFTAHIMLGPKRTYYISCLHPCSAACVCHPLGVSQVLAVPEDMDALAESLAARHTAVGRGRLARLDNAYRMLAAAAALPSQACTSPTPPVVSS